MTLIYALTILLAAVSIAPTQNAVVNRCSEGKPPEVRGLRLGMTEEEMHRVFPKVKLNPPDKYGWSQLVIQFNDDDLKFRDGVVNLESKSIVSYKAAPAFTGIDFIAVGFIDRKVCSLTFAYRNDTRWRSVEEFSLRVGDSLGLVSDWVEDETSDKARELKCRGFSVRADLEASAGGRLQLYDPTVSLLIQARRVEQDAQKRGTFKP